MQDIKAVQRGTKAVVVATRLCSARQILCFLCENACKVTSPSTAVPWEDSYSPLTAMGFRRPLTSSVLKNELDIGLIRNVQQQCDEAYVQRMASNYSYKNASGT